MRVAVRVTVRATVILNVSALFSRFLLPKREIQRELNRDNCETKRELNRELTVSKIIDCS